MNIQDATKRYEAWLASHLHVLKSDLDLKHQRMAGDPFSFLRATFYRWVQLWPKHCPELASAPAVLSVGDLHVENFGTWRDLEGRLIWGINDFDESFAMPYPNDLVRLLASALLAIRENHLSLAPAAACDAILEGYNEALKQGGRAFVLAELHPKLRALATNSLRDPAQFWENLSSLPTIKTPVPNEVLAILKAAMPERGLPFRVVHREAGLGSLGRQRFTALADWRGGKIAREAKALLPSACLWERKAVARGKLLYTTIITRAVRAADPFISVHGSWLLRRLSPYCSRIELSSLPQDRDEEKLLRAMGWETANVHLGSRAAISAVSRDLKRRKSKWLLQAASAMTEATSQDWEEWAQSKAKT